jgi:CBS domain-containing protein
MDGTGLTAADVMNPTPRTCSRFSKVVEALLIFKAEDCGMVPVVEQGVPIGVVTDRDVALALADMPDLVSRAVEEIMSKDPVSVKQTATLDEVADTFRRELVRRLLVVDGSGLLVGVIGWRDLSTAASTREVGEVVSSVVESAPGD